jgi:hypothetical protein
MHSAVPGHIDEADQTPAVVGRADPTQAVPLDLTSPVDVEDGVRKALCVEGVDVGVGERWPPLVTNVAALRTG